MHVAVHAPLVHFPLVAGFPPDNIIQSDVWGPAQRPTISGCHYYVTFIDDHSRYTWIFPMKRKSEVLSHFQKLRSQVEKETGRYI